MSNTSYHRVEKPFRFWRHVGRSQTNISLGRGNLTGTAKQALNTRPGDEIHTTSSGSSFLARGPERWVISLNAPVPFFESHHHPFDPHRFLARLSEQGYVTALPGPTARIDMVAAREAVEANVLPPNRETWGEPEPSPQLALLRGLLRPHLAALEEAGLEPRWDDKDITYDAPPHCRIKVGGEWIKAHTLGQGEVMVTMSLGLDAPGVPAPHPSLSMRHAHFRDPATSAHEARAVVDAVIEAIIAPPAAHPGR